MKWILYAFTFAACTSTGCVTVPSWWDQPKTPDTAPTTAETAKPRRLVAAEQVSEANAHEMAAALLEELDQDARVPRIAPTEQSLPEGHLPRGQSR